jgi:hypothetical protein
MARLVNGQFQRRPVRLLVCGGLMVLTCIAFTALGWFIGSH